MRNDPVPVIVFPRSRSRYRCKLNQWSSEWLQPSLFGWWLGLPETHWLIRQGILLLSFRISTEIHRFLTCLIKRNQDSSLDRIRLRTRCPSFEYCSIAVLYLGDTAGVFRFFSTGKFRDRVSENRRGHHIKNDYGIVPIDETWCHHLFRPLSYRDTFSFLMCRIEVEDVELFFRPLIASN